MLLAGRRLWSKVRLNHNKKICTCYLCGAQYLDFLNLKMHTKTCEIQLLNCKRLLEEYDNNITMLHTIKTYMPNADITTFAIMYFLYCMNTYYPNKYFISSIFLFEYFNIASHEDTLLIIKNKLKHHYWSPINTTPTYKINYKLLSVMQMPIISHIATFDYNNCIKPNVIYLNMDGFLQICKYISNDNAKLFTYTNMTIENIIKQYTMEANALTLRKYII